MPTHKKTQSSLARHYVRTISYSVAQSAVVEHYQWKLTKTALFTKWSLPIQIYLTLIAVPPDPIIASDMTYFDYDYDYDYDYWLWFMTYFDYIQVLF